MSSNNITLQSQFFKRSFGFGDDGAFKTLSFASSISENELLASGTPFEAAVTINGETWKTCGRDGHGLQFASTSILNTADGGQKLEVVFSAPATLPTGIRIVLKYEAPGKVPVLIKSMRIENESPTAIRLDGIELEHIAPSADGEMSLMLDDDYVRDAQTADGKRVRSPWIEKHHLYINQMLSASSETRNFSYPCALDHWLMPGDRFDSFRVFEFVLPSDPESRGLVYHRATRELWPWTRDRFLSCALPPARQVEEYFELIAQAAEVGYKGVHLHHGWIDRKLTSPLFTNYSDYELRPELFPNGWADVAYRFRARLI